MCLSGIETVVGKNLQCKDFVVGVNVLDPDVVSGRKMFKGYFSSYGIDCFVCFVHVAPYILRDTI